MNHKEAIKRHAYKLGADLIGVGDIGRARHAPIMMSPQGVFPGAKSVVVMGLHHPDACIELGGERHPQEIGPYSVQYLMNSRLDELSYRMATFIEELGYGAIPIASSNIWRYNTYKDLKAVFAPDVSHIYMSVVAGLADMGYNGLALSPEFGARNRFVTVITDLELAPDPLIPPGSLCDRCMLCRKHCPSQALSKEINGDHVLKIDDYEYRFANKNLWRCAWGEHFDLDLDLELPEKVTEEVIVETVKKHGVRAGEMGQCLKFCVPRARRSFDREYSRTPMRKSAVTVDESLESRGMVDRLLSECFANGADQVVVRDAAEWKADGVDIDAVLPGAASAVTLVSRVPTVEGNKRAERTDGPMHHGVSHRLDCACYDLARALDELGFRSLMTTHRNPSHVEDSDPALHNHKITEILTKGREGEWCVNTVFTRKRIASRPWIEDEQRPAPRVPDRYRATATLTDELKAFARAQGADLAGVASSARIDALTNQLRPLYAKTTRLEAHDHSIRFQTWKPEVTEKPVEVFTAEDYVPGAKSVLVLGFRMHKEVLAFATRPPAEAVGPYVFESYVTRWMAAWVGARVAKWLNDRGFRAVLTGDLMGTESYVASPRGGGIEDGFANRFTALAAGLGKMTSAGRVATPEFGIRQWFVALVTDAELSADALGDLSAERCEGCALPCEAACPTRAFGDTRITLELEGREFSFAAIDQKRCDWAKRYAVTGEEGFKYLGSELDKRPPAEGEVTAESLVEALKGHDPIKKYRPVACEPCVLACPYAREDGV